MSLPLLAARARLNHAVAPPASLSYQTDDFSTNTISHYTEAFNSGTASWAVVSGTMQATSGSHGESVLAANGISFVDGKISGVISQANDSGLVLRFTDINNYYLAVIKDASASPSNIINIYKKVAGTFTLLVSNPISFTRNTSHTFDFQITGSSLEASFDGVVISSATDSSITALGGCGMRSGSAVSGTTIFDSFTWPVVDPYYSNVVSLLNFEGTDGSTTFTDQITRVWTPSGNAQIDTTQAKFGSGSLLLDGDGDLISCASTTDMGFGTGDFTVEGFFFPSISQTGNRFLFDFRVAAGNSFMIWCSQSGASNKLGYSTEVGTNFVAGGPFTVGAWQHFEMNRAGGTIRGFVDGNLILTTTDARDYGSSQGALVGSSATANQGAIGNVDAFRITKGVARHTSNFAPPSAPFPNH